MIMSDTFIIGGYSWGYFYGSMFTATDYVRP